MKALKIKLYQNLVNYRREMSFGYVQTYPLPTPSMVKGMAHALLDLTRYHNLAISIQGRYASVVTNMQRVYKFDRPNRKPYDIIVGKAKQTAGHGIMFVDEIVDMELLLHIAFDDEDLTNQLYNAVRTKTVVLGRNEDIARVDFGETKLVDISSHETDGFRLPYDIYLPPELCKQHQLVGTYYRLPFYYEDVKSFEDKRIFSYVDTIYITKGNQIELYNITIDSDGDIVNLLAK
ncbi:CRISPR-associated protein Cas5 family [Candidatus Magnetobacterium bavaricum]|uniref:CRISPR-associated protein Cas5 family n=1 Tax=Candidatus Magnetobacterium bavaricum TaxID=29290 RepID=A0A0F3GLZ4_9BACT|nr:CRISPR-associated protein Cas5 family [Candidatus Magnetobacterium bavaricum]